MCEEILEIVKQIPVVDSHEHLTIPSSYTASREPIAFLPRGYFPSDLLSTEMSPRELQTLLKTHLKHQNNILVKNIKHFTKNSDRAR